MAFTFYIDDTSSPNAKAFLEYIKTLDFIRTTDENPEFSLSQEQLETLEDRRTARINGDVKTHSWEEVTDFVRSK